MKVLKILGLTLLIALAALALMFYKGDIPSDVVDARYTDIDSQFADFGELGRVHFRDQGGRRAPAVILLHGMAASLHTFEPWVREIGDEFRIITLDLPAHGLTGEIPSRDYSDDTMFAVINRLAAQLALDSFVIGGNSMGGGIAWRYTLAHPEKVTGLVLIDAAGNNSWYNRGRDDNGAVAGFNLLGQPWFRAIARSLDPYLLVTQGLNAAFTDVSVVNEAMTMRYSDMILREGTRSALLERTAGYDSSTGGPEVLNRISVPTLVMWGKEDALIPFAFASTFTDHIADTTTAYYDNVGHIPMEEIPGQSARDLAVFLRGLQEPAR